LSPIKAKLLHNRACRALFNINLFGTTLLLIIKNQSRSGLQTGPYGQMTEVKETLGHAPTDDA